VKTAAQLIGEFGDLETLLSRAGEIKQQKRRESLIENAEQARLSKKLVTLDDKVKLDVPLDELAVHEPDHKLLIAFLKAMEFSSLTRRVAEFASCRCQRRGCGRHAGVGREERRPSPARGGRWRARWGYSYAGKRPHPAGFAGHPPLTGEGKAAPVSPQALYDTLRATAGKSQVDRTKYETVRTIERLRHWIDRALDLGVIAIDTETTNLDPMLAELCGISLALTPNEACYIPLSHRAGGEGGNDSLFAGSRAPDQLEERDALAALKPLLEDPSVLKVAQNLKYDYQIFALRGIEMTACDDTMLMSYVVDAGKRAHGMDAMAEQWLSHKTLHYGDVAGSGKAQVCFDQVSIEKATEYAAEDADVTLRLWQLLKPRLTAERLNSVYESLERPLVPVLAAMERRGISIDRQVLSRLSGEFAQKAAGLEAEIKELAGEPLNPGSPKQIGDILFGKMGLPGAKKTKTGAWSTGVQVLEELAEAGHELPRRILDWRQVSKLKSTYTDSLPEYVNPRTKRVHTSYALAATTTGRLSSSEPNLQNIPIRNEEGRKIRRAFIATPGNKLVSADYSQIELRLLPRSPTFRN